MTLTKLLKLIPDNPKIKLNIQETYFLDSKLTAYNYSIAFLKSEIIGSFPRIKDAEVKYLKVVDNILELELTHVLEVSLYSLLKSFLSKKSTNEETKVLIENKKLLLKDAMENLSGYELCRLVQIWSVKHNTIKITLKEFEEFDARKILLDQGFKYIKGNEYRYKGIHIGLYEGVMTELKSTEYNISKEDKRLFYSDVKHIKGVCEYICDKYRIESLEDLL